MNILTFINLLSNCIIGTSIMLFVISVFGRRDHPIWENKYRAYLAKVGLGISGCGALLNVLNLSTPNATEVVLNIGLSLNFCWLSWWQYAESKRRRSKTEFTSLYPTLAPLTEPKAKRSNAKPVEEPQPEITKLKRSRKKKD